MKPNMLTNALNQQFQKGHKEGYKLGYPQGYAKAMAFTVQNYSSVMLLCLKDKFDFTTEQLKELSEHVNNTFDSVCQGYLTLGDVSDILKEENNITISFDGKVVEPEVIGQEV